MFYIKSNPNPAADGNYRELLSVVLNTLKFAEQLDPLLAPLVLPCLPSLVSLVTDFQSETALTVKFCSTHSSRTSLGSSTPPLPPHSQVCPYPLVPPSHQSTMGSRTLCYSAPCLGNSSHLLTYSPSLNYA